MCLFIHGAKQTLRQRTLNKMPCDNKDANLGAK